MNVPAKCQVCGHQFISNAIHIEDSVSMVIGGSTDCERCNGRANFVAGTYDFVGDVIAAFRAPGITRETVTEVRQIVSKAASGKITAAEAVQQTRKVSSALGAFLLTAHERGITFDRVLAVILFLHTFWASYSSDADVQAALAESRKQVELSQKILEELQKQTADGDIGAPIAATQPPNPEQTKIAKDRAAVRASLKSGTSAMAYRPHGHKAERRN